MDSRTTRTQGGLSALVAECLKKGQKVLPKITIAADVPTVSMLQDALDVHSMGNAINPERNLVCIPL